MSSIKIYELSSAGLKFFQDKENFLNELTNQETLIIQGGGDLHSCSVYSQHTLSAPGSISCTDIIRTISVTSID